MSFLTSISSALVKTGTSLAWKASSIALSAASSYWGLGAIAIYGGAKFLQYYTNPSVRERFWNECENSHLANLLEPQFIDEDSVKHTAAQTACVAYTVGKNVFKDVATALKSVASHVYSYGIVRQWTDKWTDKSTYLDLLYSLSPSCITGKGHLENAHLLHSMLQIKNSAKDYMSAFTRFYNHLHHLKSDNKLSPADRLKSMKEFLQKENLLKVSIPMDATSIPKNLLRKARTKLVARLQILTEKLREAIQKLNLPTNIKNQLSEKINYLKDTLLAALSTSSLNNIDNTFGICRKIFDLFHLITESSPKTTILLAKSELPRIMGPALNHLLPPDNLNTLFDDMANGRKAWTNNQKFDSDQAIGLFHDALSPSKKVASTPTSVSSAPSSPLHSSSSASSSIASSSASSSGSSKTLLSLFTDKSNGIYWNAEAVEYIEQLLAFCEHEPFDVQQQIESEQAKLRAAPGEALLKNYYQRKIKSLSDEITRLEMELDTTQVVTNSSLLGLFKTYGYKPATLLGKRNCALNEIDQALKIKEPKNRPGNYKGLDNAQLQSQKEALTKTCNSIMETKKELLMVLKKMCVKYEQIVAFASQSVATA